MEKENMQLCDIDVDVQIQPNGKFDVYIADECSSGCHYKDIDADDIGDLVAEQIQCLAEAYENEHKTEETPVNNNQIKIKLNDDTYLVAEKYGGCEEYPDELSVYIEKDNCAIQDICLVRPSKKHGRIVGDKVDVCVWGNNYDEDYTDRFEIGVIDEDHITIY